MEGTEPEKAQEIAEKFVARGRALATDGYIVYDIQEEKGRVPEPRPFPFRKMADPVSYAGLIKKASGKDSVVYKCVVEADAASFEEYVRQAKDTHGVDTFNLVGGATSTATYAGPSIDEAAKLLNKLDCSFGGVTIAERHTKKGNEHETLMKKTEMGAQWFISQAIYEATAMIQTINAYGTLCKTKNIKPKRILLTFAPCGRAKTMKFIHWLGVNVPEETEKSILESASPVQTSVEILIGIFQDILKGTLSSGVPLGVSVESVSIFKEEIDATHELFRRTQAIMLDDQGIPWTVRWSQVNVSSNRTSCDDVRPKKFAGMKFLESTKEDVLVAAKDLGKGPLQKHLGLGLAVFLGFLIGRLK